jgi:hypothetical protein
MDAGFGAAGHSYTIISMGGLSNRRARALPSRRSALPRPPEFEMDHQNSTVPKFHGVFDGLSERPGDMGDSQLGGGDRIALLEAGRKRLQQLREVRAEPRHAARSEAEQLATIAPVVVCRRGPLPRRPSLFPTTRLSPSSLP